MDCKGQFSIIAALLVAVVLIATVVVTFSTIRNSPVPEQPQIQSAIDQTNQAARQILGFTVGYYGSILMSTGNSTYAKGLANGYLQSGLLYTANMHPEWGTSFDVTNSTLLTYWYSNTSYSNGYLSINYNLTGLGIHGMTYNTSCSLTVQIMPTINNEAYVATIKDGSTPLINLGKQNFRFYRYDSATSAWNFVSPTNEPLAYSNGTYQLDIPSGVDVNSYLIRVEDQRGITVVASSFSLYTINLGWNSKTPLSKEYFVDNNTSNVDSSPSKGTHSNFTAMQHGPDGIMDTLTEGITTAAIPETWVSPISYEGSGWTNPSYAYDGSTLTMASASIPAKSWSSYLTLVSSAVSSSGLHYYVDRSSSQVNRVQIDVYNGSWINAYDGGGTWGAWVNVSFAEMSLSKMRFRFYNNQGGSSNSAFVCEAQFLKIGTTQSCELDLEVQWTNVNYTDTNQWLSVYGGMMGSEDIRVDVWKNSNWQNVFTDLSPGWNSIPVSQYISSSVFTIRFKGSSETNDPVQDSWQVDAVFLRSGGSGSIQSNDTLVVELLQNGTMRWLGQNLQLTTQAKPIPPIPVKSIHVNQTYGNSNSEVPFQIEDWTSEYRIPLGLTSNASVFSGRTMLVFLVTPNASRITVWWNGSDTATQTPYAYTNNYFKGDDVANGILTNGIVSLKIDGSFKVTSTQGTSTATATFMRINGENSVYGSSSAYAIYHGIVRDIVHQEAEWSSGAPNSPNVYAHMVLTLPANVTYYTYQLRLMFVNSQQSRTLTDVCPLKLTTTTGDPQTEDGVLGDYPVPSGATGLFYNRSPTQWAHHWSQFVSGTKGVGIMFTDDANQNLYYFDSIAGNTTGAISVSNSTERTIELRPVTMNPVSFTYAVDVTWYGAVVTFDGKTPIYQDTGGVISGLWILVEQLPVITVTTKS